MAASVISDPPMVAPDAVNILLVDDKPARLLAYRAILGSLEENLIEAGSGVEALRVLMTREFAVILLDVNMPGMDGFETANLIHAHPRFENTPIIFVTAVNVSEFDRMRGYKLGAVDYVTVPIIPEILRSKVMVLAELYRKRRDLQLVNESLAAANVALQAEKTRELEMLNESLHIANDELGKRNVQLQAEVAERTRVEAQLIEEDRRKNEFLATLAHELRNPLAAVANTVNIFKLAVPGADPVREAMERQLNILIRLIDDLLDAARISRGKLLLKKAPTTLSAIIESACETVAPMLHANPHALHVHRPPADISLVADRERLVQLVSNLLSNAIKYSDTGSPIDMAVTHRDDAVEISVKDYGIGLTVDQQSQIFDLFVQVDTALDRARGGLGIGLTLARRIAEMHGGQLFVHSDGPGCGSCFTVCLPALIDPLALSSTPTTEVRNAVGYRALLVDDNEDSANTLAVILQLLGHVTHCISNPHEVVACVDAFAPDVVFLDIGMPELNGYEVARRLRARAMAKPLTLVALTGWGQPEDRQRTAEAGFDHHLVKPADLAAIQRVFDGLETSSL